MSRLAFSVDFTELQAAGELSLKCRRVISSSVTLPQLEVASRYASLVVAECARRRLPFTFDFSSALSYRLRCIVEGWL